MMSPLKSVTTMTPMEWNCSSWRMKIPSDAVNRALETNPKYATWSAKLIHVSGFQNYLDPAIQELVGPVDIIVFQRNLISEGIFDAIDYWRGMQKPVIVDLDDAYQILPFSNPAHAFWIENKPNLDPAPLKMLETGLAKCDGLTAPNRLLLSDWQHVVAGYYLPNYAEADWWTDLPERTVLKAERGLTDRIIIGWGGSVSHYDSWWGSGIREAATKVCQQHPEVLWMICGNDSRVYEQLPVPAENKLFQPGVMPQDWPKIVQTFDIGVAPLFGPYDQRRSWIKGLEYLLAGVPWVGTAGEPYRDIGQLGTLVSSNAEAWTTALTAKIKHLEAEQTAGQAKVQLARKWLMSNQLPHYEQVYSEIIAKFRATYVRLPRLFFVGRT